MSARTYYVICEDNCKFEGMTKEEIFDAIAEATGNTPTPVDNAFITKIKEQNANRNLKIWAGTEAQYNAITHYELDTVYLIGKNQGSNYMFKEPIFLEEQLVDHREMIDTNRELIIRHSTRISNLEGVSRYDKYYHKSVALGSSTVTKAHGLPAPSAGSIWDAYEVVQAYVVKTGTDSTKIYYPMPYIYGSAKYINYKLDKDNITVDNNSDWTGYTAHFIFGRRTNNSDTAL